MSFPKPRLFLRTACQRRGWHNCFSLIGLTLDLRNQVSAFINEAHAGIKAMSIVDRFTDHHYHAYQSFQRSGLLDAQLQAKTTDAQQFTGFYTQEVVENLISCHISRIDLRFDKRRKGKFGGFSQ